jgi:GT2 family glycosyltransferase
VTQWFVSKSVEKVSGKMNSFSPPDVSICMVSLNCWGVLKNCLDSVRSSVLPFSYEVIIVDNASSDNTASDIKAYDFPRLRLLQNDRNVGFTKATNQAIKLSSGRYILWLNTDTVLKPGALHKLCLYLEENSKVGIVGPKVLNPDGTFQPQCRRGLPTPWASLAHLLRLDRLWPRHTGFGQYLLSYLPVDQACQVAAVSGCCLMARRQVWNDIGPLDEDYFGFGEDLDWCARAKRAGWEVWYYPGSCVIHLKGQGGVHAKPYHKVWGIHQAMRIFYFKNLKANYPWVVTGLVYGAIWISFVLSGTMVLLRRITQGRHDKF